MHVDERGIAGSRQKSRMIYDIIQKTDVALDTAQTEFLQTASRGARGFAQGQPPTTDFDQQRIVMGGDTRTGGKRYRRQAARQIRRGCDRR